MRNILVTLILTSTMTLAAVSATSAAGPAVAKRSVASSSHNYWLSDGLNRLVFWQPPSASHGERSTRQ